MGNIFGNYEICEKQQTVPTTMQIPETTLKIGDINTEIPTQLTGGADLRDFKTRYRNKHDVFDMIRQVEEKHGMNGGGNNDETTTTDKTETVFNHSEQLMTKNGDKMEGGCACGVDASKLPVIKGGKKDKKKRRKFYEDSASDSTSASESSDSSAKLDNSNTSSTSDEEESSSDAIMYYENGEDFSGNGGLSVFPFNSSDMASSLKSDRNKKMYKRRG